LTRTQEVNVDGTRVVAWGNGDWDWYWYWIGLHWAKQEPTFRQKWGKVLITHKDVGTRNKNYYYKGNRKGKAMEKETSQSVMANDSVSVDGLKM